MNTIKKYPEIGDIMIKVGDDFRFLGQDATPEFVEAQQCVGVVYYVNGNHVKLVGGENKSKFSWSCVDDYEIEDIPKETGDYDVVVNQANAGKFHYEKSTGTKEEFVQQLNVWLAGINPSYEAYMHNGVAVLLIGEYREGGHCTIASCKMRKRIGEEIKQYNGAAPLIATKLSKEYCGVNLFKMIDFCRNSSSAHCNPTDEITAEQLYKTFPCSEKYFTGPLGGLLRKAYRSYEDYMQACMGNPWGLRVCTNVQSGKVLCELLSRKRVMIKGNEKQAYDAVEFARKYDSGVEGFRAGAWWLPSMHELMLLMKNISLDTSDKINNSLKKKGWQEISPYMPRWSSSRYDDKRAWNYYNGGMAESRNCDGVLESSAVTTYNLKY